MIPLVDPFPVVEGGVYSFGLSTLNGPMGLLLNPAERYADGAFYFFDGTTTSEQPGDLAFVVRIEPHAPVPVRRWTWGAAKAAYR